MKWTCSTFLTDAAVYPSLGFKCIQSFVDEFCIVPRLWDCVTPVLGMSVSLILFKDTGAIEVCYYYFEFDNGTFHHSNYSKLPFNLKNQVILLSNSIQR